MKRKIISLTMTFLMVMSLFTGITTSAFSDVTEDHRHSEAITYLAEKGVINGYEDGSFKPEEGITRAEFTKMLLEFWGFGNIYGDAFVTTGFSDVDSKTMTVTTKNEAGEQVTTSTPTEQHWAAGYIKLAVDKGIVNGYGDGTFGPDDPVKYEESIKMIVCCLGREEMAKTRSEMVGIPLWPDSYLSIGNELMTSSGTDYLLGANASRSNIAQMIYNVKDVPVIIAPNISIGGMTGGGGTGGGGGGGVNIAPSVNVISGMETYGIIVAADKVMGEQRKRLVIDDNIVIDGTPVTMPLEKNIIVKLHTPMEGSYYQTFHTGGTDYSHLLGYSIKLTYRFNPDMGAAGRYEVESVAIHETDVTEIKSDEFMRANTTEKNNQSSDKYICYSDGRANYDLPLFVEDLDTLKVIYNNKLIDVNSHSITMADLMPTNGKIKVIDAYDDNVTDLIVVDSYETYVVGTRSFNTTPKTITDKFRKELGGTPITLNVTTSNPGDSIVILKDNAGIEPSGIPASALLKVARSKCGTSTVINIERTTENKNVTIDAIQVENGVKKAFTINNKLVYLSDYFRDYVDSELTYQAGDRMTIYLNDDGEIVWGTVAQVSYSTGYLIRVLTSEMTGELSFEILTSAGQKQTFTMASSNTKYITNATTCLSGVTPDRTDAHSKTYKNLSQALIKESLMENAATINAPKADRIKLNAEYSQPIMYAISEGTKISTLVTLQPDTSYLFDGEGSTYTYLNGNHIFTNTGGSFSSTSSGMFVFVPNNRTLYGANGYKIGTASSSSISKKLVEYMKYNIEPYFVTDAQNNQKRSVFVVYNQDIDMKPNYRSENIIVKNILGGLNGWTVTGYVGSNTNTRTFNCSGVDNAVYGNAFVLGENFERTGERRAVEAGDIIRLGYSPSGAIEAAEIIFDASADQKATMPKSTAISIESTPLSVSNPSKNFIYYYARIGKITSFDSSAVKEYCNIEINGGATSMVYVGPNFATKQVLMYDHTIEGAENNKWRTVTMGDLWVGDMLYVWQGEDLDFKQIYAVRYPAEVAPES